MVRHVHAKAETEWQQALELEKRLKASSRLVGCGSVQHSGLHGGLHRGQCLAAVLDQPMLVIVGVCMVQPAYLMMSSNTTQPVCSCSKGQHGSQAAVSYRLHAFAAMSSSHNA
jgi:hypothetical protein